MIRNTITVSPIAFRVDQLRLGRPHQERRHVLRILVDRLRSSPRPVLVLTIGRPAPSESSGGIASAGPRRNTGCRTARPAPRRPAGGSVAGEEGVDVVGPPSWYCVTHRQQRREAAGDAARLRHQRQVGRRPVRAARPSRTGREIVGRPARALALGSSSGRGPGIGRERPRLAPRVKCGPLSSARVRNATSGSHGRPRRPRD